MTDTALMLAGHVVILLTVVVGAVQAERGRRHAKDTDERTARIEIILNGVVQKRVEEAYLKGRADEKGA